jgi:hypothetical protein
MISAHPPSISPGPSIEIRKDVRKILRCPNSSCQKDIDVTNLNFGTNIKCEKCGNVTWVPEYKLKWWFKLRTFILTIILSFILGVIASFSGTYAYENFIKVSKESQTLNSGMEVNK